MARGWSEGQSMEHGLVMLPVCIQQAEACDPMGMEVVDEVADLFAQE